MNEAKIQNFNNIPAQPGQKVVIDPDYLLVRITDDIQEPFPSFSIASQMIASPGNLVTIKAKQKAGKTFLICIFAAAYYNSNNSFLAVNARPTAGKKFYWLDSEQSKSQIFKVLKRTYRMMNLPDFANDDLAIFYIAELSIDDRFQTVETIAARPDCEAMTLDVVTDFVNDPNDLKETKAAADRLQAIAKKHNIIIICTIHENKDNTHATGNLGSALMKKSETVLGLEKRNGIFTVKPAYSRHGDAESFSFTIDPEGLPVEADSPLMMTKAEVLEQNIQSRFKKILAVKRLPHKELVEIYMEKAGCAVRTARNHITQALDMDLIEVCDKLYGLKITFNEDNDENI